MKKQPERTAKTRDALISAFWSLYCEKSIEKITIQEITRTAGLYRSTFYAYFPDVYAVLHEIESSLLSSFESLVSVLFQSEDMQSALQKVLSFYEDNGEYLAVLLGPDGDRKFYDTVRKMIKAVLLEQTNLEEAELRDNMRLEIMLSAISSSLIAILEYWYDHRDSVSIQEVFLVGSDYLQHGALPYMKKLGIPFLR